MLKIISIIISILPIYLIGLYIYKKDKDKEEKKLLRKIFIWGIISVIPTLILELLVGSFFPSETSEMNLIVLFIYVFISIAIIEEICKFFVTYKIAYNNIEFDQIYDAIVFSVFSALGFAGIENILYVIGSLTETSGIVTSLLRAVTAVPAHACFAIILGNYIAIAKINQINKNEKEERKNLIKGILLAALLHTIYDYCVFTELIPFLIIELGVIIFMYVFSIRKVKSLSKIEGNIIPKENQTVNTTNRYCPQCGNIANGNFCQNCGTNLQNNVVGETNNNHDNNLTQ